MAATPDPLSILLAAALCIAASGVPDCLRRGAGTPAWPVSSLLNGAGSALGLLALALYARGGAREALQLGALPIGELVFGIDALSYEGAVNNANIAGLGAVSLVEGNAVPVATADDNVTVGRVLQRFPDGSDADDAATDWALSSTPTPGAPNQ